MSKQLGTLTLDLVAKTGNFVEGLTKSERTLERFVNKAKKNATQVATAVTALGAGVAAATIAMIKSYSKSIDETAKSARQLETSYSSFATLKKSAEDSGVALGALMSAGRTLNREIGKALSGNEATANSFRKIGLEAKEIANLPLDKKIATINDALDKNIDANMRASVSAEIFGSRNGQVIASLDSNVINEATRKLELFGLRLSDVDAQKVEDANTAISDFKLLMDSVGTQLTVQIAPVLRQIGELFLESAENAGGLGNVIGDSVEKGIKSFSTLVNIGDIVKRSFIVVAQSINMAFLSIQSTITDVALLTNRALNILPGIDRSENIKDAERAIREQKLMFKEFSSDFAEQFKKPLAGQDFLKFYENAKKRSEELATQNKKSRVVKEELLETHKAMTKATAEQKDKIKELIESLELEVDFLGMSRREKEFYKATLEGATVAQLDNINTLLMTIETYEKAEQVQKEYKDLIASLRSEEEQRTDTLREQLDLVNESTASIKEQQEVSKKLASSLFSSDDPIFSNKNTSENDYYNQQEVQLEIWYKSQLEMLESYRSDFAQLNEIWDKRELEVKKHYYDQLENIGSLRNTMLLNSTEQMFSEMTSAVRAWGGETSGVYKALFAMEKSFAIARSIIKIQEGIAMASANPYPYNLGAMASVAGATANIIGTIGQVAFTGQAHDGIDKVPKSGTWLLEKGERVTTEKTSKKLDRTLDNIQSKNNNQNFTINLIEDSSKAGRVDKQIIDDKIIANVFVSNIFNDGLIDKAIKSKYGLRTVGR